MVKYTETPHSPDKDPIQKLLGLMEKLRDPDDGCPWNKNQTLESLTPFTIEEAYEVVDTVKFGNMEELREELGDLLFQIIFYSQIAQEENLFSFEDVVTSITDKLIRRHPHVFDNHDNTQKNSWRPTNWDAQKEVERLIMAEKKGNTSSALDGVARALPALIRAQKLQRRAARIGFDWSDASQVIKKVQEEFQELKIEIENQNKVSIKDELGDLFFTLVSLARHLEIDPETALNFGNEKFERRFKRLEKYLETRGLIPSELQIEELELAWKNIKSEEF